MSDYTQTTDFSAKDGLSTGDPEKIISGADMDAELDAISTAIASKVDDGTSVTFTETTDDATEGPGVILHRDRANPADADLIGYFDFQGEDSGSNATTYAKLLVQIDDVTAGTEDGALKIQTLQNASLVTMVDIDTAITVGGTVASDTDSTDDLGTSSVRWANLYVDSIGDTGQDLTVAATTVNLPSGHVFDYNSADVTVTHSANTLTITGGGVVVDSITSGGNIVSDTDSTDDLGTTGVRWANLYVDDITATTSLTAGGVITGLTIEATGDTSAGDNAAMGYTATEGLILTGQGSNNDVTIKNDADEVIARIPTGTRTLRLEQDTDNELSLDIFSTHGGDTTGVFLRTWHDSASPAGNDPVMYWQIVGEDDQSGGAAYGVMKVVSEGVINNSEDGRFEFETIRAGTPGTNELVIGGGMYLSGISGGAKGVGQLNFTAYYDDNVSVTCYPFEQYLDGSINEQKWDDKVPNRVIPATTGTNRYDQETGETIDTSTPEQVIVRTHEPMRKFKARIGTEYDPLDIDKYAQHWKDKRHLTAFPNEEKYDVNNDGTGKQDMGNWIQQLIETVEIQAIHIDNLNQRLKVLEAAQP